MKRFNRIVAVSLNSAIDRIIEVPGLTLGEHQRGDRLAYYPAGKGINVAKTIAILGQQCIVTGFVGEPELEWYQTDLAEIGGGRIDFKLLAVEGRTRENITLIDPESGYDTHITEQGYSIGHEHVARLRGVLREGADENTLVCFSGSLPPGLSTYDFGDLIEACTEAGMSVVVDTSDDALQTAIGMSLWMIKPNIPELAQVAGRPMITDEDNSNVAYELAENMQWVLLSRGEEGAWLFSSRRPYAGYIELDQDRVKNTVGCGDCLLGGFLAGWIAGGESAEPDPAAALRLGVAAATANAVNLTSAIFKREEVDEFAKQVAIE